MPILAYLQTSYSRDYELMNTELKYHFASDNTSGVCPEAWQALEEANSGYHPSYGADSITAHACERFREFFENPGARRERERDGEGERGRER